MSESLEQIRFVSWFRRNYPGMRIISIPNGGLRNKVVASRMKAEGMSPGVPDLFVPEVCLWIEMKRKNGGSLSKHQKDWLAYLRDIGHHTMVCHGYDDACEQVTQLFSGEPL